MTDSTDAARIQHRGKSARGCKLHHVPMEKTTVPVVYGFIFDSPGYLKARQNFPNAAEPNRGGCVVVPGLSSDQEYRVWACPACTTAWEAWLKGQGD
ncbi:MAG TPA: hypothetical protein VN638_08590 [Nitrospiraceae bacterium]|nr:hypothetical protein [Nitrospiraceae bacterium]